MKRYEALEEISENLNDELVVCNIGYPSRELYQIKDRPQNFYMLGSMGLASSIALGLALSQPKKVIAIDGDGSTLMNMGSLATISYYHPENFTLIILDNGAYGSTGDQPTIAEEVKIENICKGCGLETKVMKNSQELDNLTNKLGESETRVLVVKIEKGNADVPIIDMKPEEIKNRFMREI